MERTTLLALWGMARPTLLNLLVVIYLIGALISRATGTGFDVGRLILGFLPLLFIAISAHYVNEFADHETDALTKPTMFSGGSGVVGYRNLALYAGYVSLGVAVIFTAAGVALGAITLAGLVLLAIGASVAWMYSVPPFQLAWRGWGEVINAVLAGIVLPLYGYTVQTGVISWEVIVGCIPFASLVFVMILATNWADRVADSQVGKRTLTTRLNAQQLRRLYAGIAILSFLTLPFLYEWVLPAEVVLSTIPAIPALYWAWRSYTQTDSPYPTAGALLLLVPLQLGAWIIAA